MEHPHSIEELLTHAGWLRGLAARLCKDAGLAEDLVQDTWVAALRHPPGEGTSARPWLATVLRNQLANLRRGAARREANERGRAREADSDGVIREGTDSTARVAEAQRLLAEAVARLEEPLREAIVHRYYHGLDSNAIGRKLGLPAGTVRWRLGRAREELRADLERRSGGEPLAWAVALLPLAREPRVVTTSAAGLSMAQLGGVLGVLGAAALLWWSAASTGEEARTVETASLSTVEAHSSSVVPPQEGGSTRAARLDAREQNSTPVSEPSSARDPAAPAPLVDGIVLVLDGRSPASVRLQLSLGEVRSSRAHAADPDPDLRQMLDKSRLQAAGGAGPSTPNTIAVGADGRFSIPALPDGTQGRLRAPGFVLEDGSESLAFRAPASGLVLRLVQRVCITGRLVDERGAPIAGAWGLLQAEIGAADEDPDEAGHEFRCESLATDAAGIFTSLLEDAEKSTARMELCFELDDGFAAAAVPDFDPREGLDLGDLVAHAVRPLAVEVTDAHGLPLAGAVARIDGGIPISRASEPSDAGGATELAFAPRSAFRLRVDAIGHETARVEIAEGLLEVRVELSPAAGVDLRLRGDEAGRAEVLFLVRAPAEVFGDQRPSYGAAQLEGMLRAQLGQSEPVPHPEAVDDGTRVVRCYRAGPAGGLLLSGLRPGVPFTIETREDDGRVLDVRSLVLRPGVMELLEVQR